MAVISDTSFFEGNLPAITIGLRGNAYVQIDVEGSPVDLHSGTYGGAVQNPANALAQIIAALKGPDGRIRIPGFYDDVVGLTDREREAFAALPFDDEAWRAHSGLGSLVGEAGFTTLERIGARPTLDVNGIWGGFQGEGSKTIIPAHAHAKVSCRLVPDQDPDRIFELIRAYVAEIAPPGVTVTVRDLHGGRPFAHADRPSRDQGGCACACRHVRAGTAVRARGRFDPRGGRLQHDPRVADRDARLHAAGRQRARTERVDGPHELRAGHPLRGPAVGRAGRYGGTADGTSVKGTR